MTLRNVKSMINLERRDCKAVAWVASTIQWTSFPPSLVEWVAAEAHKVPRRGRMWRSRCPFRLRKCTMVLREKFASHEREFANRAEGKLVCTVFFFRAHQKKSWRLEKGSSCEVHQLRWIWPRDQDSQDCSRFHAASHWNLLRVSRTGQDCARQVQVQQLQR